MRECLGAIVALALYLASVFYPATEDDTKAIRKLYGEVIDNRVWISKPVQLYADVVRDKTTGNMYVSLHPGESAIQYGYNYQDHIVIAVLNGRLRIVYFDASVPWDGIEVRPRR